MRTRIIVLIFVGLLLGSPIFAQEVPTTVSFVARVDRTGAALPATIQFEFAIYDQAVDGTKVWEESHEVAPVGGLVYAELGTSDPLDGTVFGGAQRFLEVHVDGEAMEPRITLSSVPYAIRAGVANDVTGDIHPTSVTVADTLVIDEEGQWVGDTAGLAGMPGEAGPAGATGPQGASGPSSWNACVWQVQSCSAAHCDATCPTGQHPVSGGCDSIGGQQLSESNPSSHASFTSPVGWNGFNSWHCLGTGNIQGAYALCCPNL